MKRRTRRYYTEEEKSLMWDRWQKDETLGSIARSFGRYPTSMFPLKFSLGSSPDSVAVFEKWFDR